MNSTVDYFQAEAVRVFPNGCGNREEKEDLRGQGLIL